MGGWLCLAAKKQLTFHWQGDYFSQEEIVEKYRDLVAGAGCGR